MTTLGAIIPIYGQKRYLHDSKKAYISLINQRKSFDEIVVNFEKDGDLATITNETIKNMNSEYICIIGADDWIEPEWREKFDSAYEREPLSIYEPLVAVVRNNLQMKAVRIPRSTKLGVFEKNHIIAGAPFRREEFLDVGGYAAELELLEDWHCWLKMITAGSSYGLFDGVYYYRENQVGRNTFDASKYNKARKEIIKVVESKTAGWKRNRLNML